MENNMKTCCESLLLVYKYLSVCSRCTELSVSCCYIRLGALIAGWHKVKISTDVCYINIIY